MELRVFESPGQEWDEFASRHTDLIFYQSAWSRVLKEGLGGQPLYFYLKEGKEIVAGLPGVLFNFKIVKILYASIPYGHIIGEQSYYPAFFELLDNEFINKGIDQVRLVESPFYKSIPVKSFKPISGKCTLLELKDLHKEEIWESYKKNIRRDVRKAQKSGVNLRVGNSKEDARLFYKLYLASMERNKAMAKYPLRWFETIYEMIFQKGSGAVLLAELNHEAIAGAVFIYSPSSTHYFHNGSRHEFLNVCPNELLVHTSIENAIDQGHSVFDFMGSAPDDLPLLRFKEKWGSRSLDVLTYVKDYHFIRGKAWELGKRIGSSRLGDWLIKIIRK